MLTSANVTSAISVHQWAKSEKYEEARHRAMPMWDDTLSGVGCGETSAVYMVCSKRGRG
jgi:hypothetical protein